MILYLTSFGKQIDAALNESISVASKLVVIFFLWLLVSIPLFLLAIVGAYFSGWLIALSIISNILWIIICGAMIGRALENSDSKKSKY